MEKLKLLLRGWKRGKKHRVKRSVTLLELLIVVSLIAVAFTVVGVQGPRFIKKTRFSAGVNKVIGKLSLAQEVMLNFQTDVKITFEPRDGGLEVHLQTESHVPENVLKQINHRSWIKGIERVEFNGSALTFDTTLGRIPEGELRLFSGNWEETLILRGFPSRIKRGEHVAYETEATYPEEIFSAF